MSVCPCKNVLCFPWNNLDFCIFFFFTFFSLIPYLCSLKLAFWDTCVCQEKLLIPSWLNWEPAELGVLLTVIKNVWYNKQEAMAAAREACLPFPSSVASSITAKVWIRIASWYKWSSGRCGCCGLLLSKHKQAFIRITAWNFTRLWMTCLDVCIIPTFTVLRPWWSDTIELNEIVHCFKILVCSWAFRISLSLDLNMYWIHCTLLVLPFASELLLRNTQ